MPARRLRQRVHAPSDAHYVTCTHATALCVSVRHRRVYVSLKKPKGRFGGQLLLLILNRQLRPASPCDLFLRLLLPLAGINCTFEAPCPWKEDANDWGEAQWTVERTSPQNSVMCLAKPKWMLKNKIQARLWSPAIGQKRLDSGRVVENPSKIQCLAFLYKISHLGSSLSLLKRQKG